jgi:hypothetical protein
MDSPDARVIFDLTGKGALMDEMVRGKRVEIKLQPPLHAAIDAWRREHPDLPPRAEAIVRLTEIGLEAEAAKKAKPRPKK